MGKGKNEFDIESRFRAKNELKILLEFLSYALKFKWTFIAALFFIVVDISSEVAIPFVIRYAVDVGVGGEDLKLLIISSGGLLLAVTINSLARGGSIYLTNKLGQNVLYELRTIVLSHILKLPLNFFDRTHSGKLVIRVTNDIENLNEFLVSGLITFFVDALIIVGVIFAMFILNVELAICVLSVFPVMLLITLFFRKHASEIYLKVRKKISELNSFIAESIIGIKTLKTLPAYLTSLARFKSINKEYSDYVFLSIKMFAFFFSSIIMLSSISLSLALGLGGLKILSGEISFGTFLAFWYAVNKLFDPIWDFSEKYNIFQSAVASAKRLHEIMSEKTEESIVPKISISDNGSKREIRYGKIDFSDVHFSYDGIREIIRGASFSINPAETVAIVGLTGAGKTTIANLLTRMYIPQKGKILIDDQDISNFPLDEIRRKIAFVQQDLFILPGKVIDNITLGDKSLEKYVLEIIRKIDLKIDLFKFVSSDRGGLSSGEKQIISILRALCRDPKIIIFDEATAFIDLETEKQILSILDIFAKEKTLIKIAHRISTIKNSDKVILIKNGVAYEFPPEYFRSKQNLVNFFLNY